MKLDFLTCAMEMVSFVIGKARQKNKKAKKLVEFDANV